MRYTLLLAGIFFLITASNRNGGELPCATEMSYYQAFGQNYIEAEKYIESNQQMGFTFARYGIEPKFAWAIVFPELIRYNALKDKLELASLYTLYVNFGKSYSNFSVGPFQMKPSFVEQLEKEFMHTRQLSGNNIRFEFDTTDTRAARSARIGRLQKPEWQARYLVICIRSLENQYSANFKDSPDKKLRFFASAYNCGYNLPAREIKKFSVKKFYHTALTNNSAQKRYAYADISEYYYKSLKTD